MRSRSFRWVALFMLACVAGCVQQPVEPGPPPTPVGVPDSEPLEQVEVSREKLPPPRPIVEPPAPVAGDIVPDTIAVVLSDRTPAFENVANQLIGLLDDYLLYNLEDRSLTPSEVFAGISELQASVVIAIGLAATREAILRSPVPVVFCQVFNIASAQDTAVAVRGVASTPPLSRQVAAWKEVNPDLKSVGAILGPGHEALIAEAQEATAAHGVAFNFRIANSDRETLFIFQRLAPAIDGFWLFPDNRVLSVEILEDLMDYAARHDIDVAVFNQALLGMGATLSATTVDADIAATALAVATRVAAGDAADVPWMTPLNDARIVTRKGLPRGGNPTTGGKR